MASLPEIIDPQSKVVEKFSNLDNKEIQYIEEGKRLFENEFYSYSLLAVWNAAVNNLKRRVELYGVDLWISVTKEEPGRKKYDKDGETVVERWNNVEDLTLINGATKLGLLNPKAGKSLEMINWMRNHASPAHDSDNRVERNDAISLILLLENNLFKQPFPDPVHSVSSIFEPIKFKYHDIEELNILSDQIRSYRNQDIRNIFGFFMDLLAKGEEPAKSNIMHLFPFVWEKANDDLRKVLGLKYHSYMVLPDSDSLDNGAKIRIFELLIKLNGIKYIPEGTRSKIYRRAAEKLAEAKDSKYGWREEEAASRNIAQLGTYVPSISFEQVYQEILSVWCGNY